MIKKIVRKIKHPKEILLYFSQFHIYDFISDKTYLRFKYWLNMDKKLDLKNPKTFNEKLQWLKLYNRKPEYTRMVDKYAVREYIKEKLGEEYLIPLLGVWDSPDDIDFDKLPNQFVLKCNHNSGLGMCICKDKLKLDIDKVKKELKKGLKQNYYLTGREWPYKDVPRKIVAEKYMVDESGTELKDYKLFCFNGKVQYIQVDFDRFTNHKRNFYDTAWNYVPFTTCYPTDASRIIDRPILLEKMIYIAEQIARSLGGVPVVRIDLYYIVDRIYFGEITFYHGSGYEKFYPSEWDYKLGKMIDLNLIKTEK